MLFFKKFSKAGWLSKFIVCICLVLLFFAKPFGYLEYKLQDKLYQRPGLTDQRIVVIGIDETSQEKLGRFQQWSRQTMADAINILNSSEDGKPAVIAVDILFGGESNDPQADANLAKAAADGGNVVVAAIGVKGEELSGNKVVETWKNIETPFPALASAAQYGLANGDMDATDGIVRNALIHTSFNGEAIPSFAYQIYRQYTGEAFIPELKEDSELFISYSGYPGDFSWGNSFSDIFEEDFDPGFFADSIVLIGPYATAMMDSYYTPISSGEQMYGVEIHANVVQMLLDKDFKHRVSEEVNFLIFLTILLLGVLFTFLLDIRILTIVYFGIAVGFLFLALYLFQQGHIIEIIYPLFTLGVLLIYQTIYVYLREVVEKAKIKDTLKKYVDPKLADQLIEMGNAQRNEVGTKRDIAVLFVDIRGFTTMGEELKDQPGKVVEILNEYLEHTSECIFKNGGSVDKFIGDATMALFNGFAPLDDYVFHAVRAALDIVKGTEALNEKLLEKYNVDVGFGVGIQCGEAIVGNLGPAFRKDYTAIGDTVNTASRLESRAKKSEILISEQVCQAIAGRIETEFVGELQLKGKAAPMRVYAAIRLVENNIKNSDAVQFANAEKSNEM